MTGPFDDEVESKKIISKSKRKVLEEEGFIVTPSGSLANKMKNVILIMEKEPDLCGLFRYNDFTGAIEYAITPSWDDSIKKGKKIDDGDEIYIKNWITQKYKFEPSVSLIKEGLFIYSKRQKYHPVKNYLESLKWDGKKRVDCWLNDIAGVEKNVYSSLVGRKMLCAMVKRIYEPGCQFDNLIILEGKEGIYKTSMLRILGGEWYAPFSIKAESKDAVDVMMGKWILEMEELATMKGSEIEYVDAFLSRNVDRVRLSYRRNAQDFPRQCIFIGTMNPIGNNQYLRKQSQNRRFWPVECNDTINIDLLKEIKDQLFAETMTFYKNERLYIDDEKAINIVVGKQEERKAYDFWTDLINDYLDGKVVARAVDIFTSALSLDKSRINHTSSIRLGICMRNLGWLPRQYGSKRQKYYVHPHAHISQVNEELGEIAWDE